jgi:hypothetical protein
MITKEQWRDDGQRFQQSKRRLRALLNLALASVAQFPRADREAAYRKILLSLRDHIGEPEAAAAAIARFLMNPAPRAA